MRPDLGQTCNRSSLVARRDPLRSTPRLVVARQVLGPPQGKDRKLARLEEEPRPLPLLTIV